MKKVLIIIFASLFLMTIFAGVITADQKKVEKKEVKKCGHEMKCAVAGTVIKDAKKALKAEYKGKTYYFCCEKCQKAFKADPEKYVKKLAEGCKKDCCKKTKCPVSGKEIKDIKKAVKGEYKGKTVYFCSEDCKKAFEANPEKYAKKCAADCKKACCAKKCAADCKKACCAKKEAKKKDK